MMINCLPGYVFSDAWIILQRSCVDFPMKKQQRKKKLFKLFKKKTISTFCFLVSGKILWLPPLKSLHFKQTIQRGKTLLSGCSSKSTEKPAHDGAWLKLTVSSFQWKRLEYNREVNETYHLFFSFFHNPVQPFELKERKGTRENSFSTWRLGLEIQASKW